MKSYREIAPSADEISKIMDRAIDAYKEWGKANDPENMTPRRIFYAGFYLGTLVQKAQGGTK